MKKELMIIVLLIGCLLCPPTYSQAQAPPPAGLDILFVVDQSGSMGGSPAHPIPNDPNALRFYAPINAMRWLGSDRLQVHHTTTYRIGVLHFGDQSQAGLDWQTIAPANSDEWEAQKAGLESALAFDDFRTDNLGGTNFYQAMEQARRMFDLLPEDPAGPHLQALVILTDGEPSVSGQTAGEHMRRVQDYVTANFPNDQFTICAIAMNDVSGDYWTSMEPWWNTITQDCAVKLVSNETDVGAAFRVILRQLTADLPDATPTEHVIIDNLPAEIVVPPYLQSIAFTLDKANPQVDGIDIEVLEGDPFSTSQEQIEGENEPIETITIYDPPPGRWQIRATEGATLGKVDMRKINANSVMLSPAGVALLNIPTQVEYQLQTSQGHPLPQYDDPQYALQIADAEIVADSQSWPLAMTYDAARNVYVADFTPTQAGRYALHLSATSRDIDGQKVIVSSLSEVGSFDVGEPVITLQAELPETQLLFQPRPLAYAVEMNGQAVTSDASRAIMVTFNSGSQTWTVPLTSGSDGVLRGEFIPVAAGAYQASVALYMTGSGGQQEEVYREPLSPFHVSAPGVSAEVSDLTQHCAGNVTFQIDDSLGQTLSAPPGYTLSTEVVLSDGSRAPLTTTDGRTYRGQATPIQSGLQTLDIEIKTRDPDGEEWQTLRKTVGDADVVPSTGLHLEIVEPDEDARMPAHTLTLETIPLTVTLVLKDQAGSPADPAQVMTGEPIQLIVLNEEGELAPVDVTMTQIESGHFQGVIGGLGAGSYTLTAKITGQTICGYHAISDQTTRNIRRTESPVMIGFKIGGPIALLALIAGIIVYARRNQQAKAHPCKGRVVIVDNETGDYVLNITFPTDRHRRNRFVYKGKKLGPKAQGYFSQIEFACSNQDDSERGIIGVRIIDLGGEERLDTELRPPKSSRSAGKKIRKTKLYIYKDPMDR
ncbi:MAG: VWA domain-containing protein [Chloroflexi bacterium]|nr:VWA domain-containing protein [Chloroflexota bacterium]